MNILRFVLLAFTVLVFTATGLAMAENPEISGGAARAADVPARDEVLRVITQSARAEIEHRKDILIDPKRGTDWLSATFFVGAVKLAAATDNRELWEFCQRSGERFNHAHRGDGAPVHLINADDQAIGDLYQALSLRTGSPGVLMPLRQRLDYTVPYLTFQPEPKRLVWWWCDALFMAPPLLSRMSVLTGDPRYLDAMDVQWWRVCDRLYDKNEHLFARDARFIERRSPNGKKIFWSRGQGWVFAGLARVLEVMPEDFPSRPRYVDLFREMAAKIASVQQPDGLWRASLLDTEAFPEPETSGTAFFTYALAFGINHGLLDRATYLPVVLKGWAGLNRHLLPNGLLGQVQTAGDQPVPTRRETTTLYASGAFLLAGLEVANLRLPVTPLPLELPQPPKLKYEAAGWSLRPLPKDATPTQIQDHERGEAERSAVADQAFDPMIDDPAYVSPVGSDPGKSVPPKTRPRP